ncbi:MAG TPA: hypothetical protein VN694_15565 [Caulobacteraceae bacterium]|nr:hypothetical protein [Caulobacteraceae bacterium]
MYEGLEQRLSALEQIIIIIITGGRGGWWPPRPNPGDSFATDYSRLDTLQRFVRPRGDPPPIDVSRLSLVAAEQALLDINAELTRLQGLTGEVEAHMKRLRSGKAGG